MLALLEVHHILHVSRIRVKETFSKAVNPTFLLHIFVIIHNVSASAHPRGRAAGP
jgi:hypothetical protein